MRSRLLGTAAAVALVVAGLGGAPAAEAGGGPETTVVVVNADSPLSRLVANEYVRRRRIPPGHVCWVPGLATLDRTDVVTFRDRLLKDVDRFLAAMPSGDRVDLVVWSIDFPYAVDFSAAGPSTHPNTPAVASLTGLTYLQRLAATAPTGVWANFSTIVNGYFRRSPATTQDPRTWDSRGFSSRVGWGEAEEPDPAAPADAPTRHRLSAMLGWAGTWGNSVPEILAYLAAAADVDGTEPAGTVYLCRSGDEARSGPRAPFFDETVRDLAALGRRGEVLSPGVEGQIGSLPLGKSDVLGAVVGVADFVWPACGSRLLPGSFADHLTSFAADFSHGNQTKCSEWLRHGAAGTCGTVVEPLNPWTKFPVPRLHVHYAMGCSLSEAFYQSVASPYQQLLLGDPLARPFAKFARVWLAPPEAPVSGVAAISARVDPPADRPLDHVELWVDGALVAEGTAGADLPWTTTGADDGTHEVRVVALEKSLVATRSFASTTFVVANGNTAAPTIAWPKAPVAYDAAIDLQGKAPGAKTVEVWADGRRVAEAPVRGDAWGLKGFPAASLGLGPVTLQARAVPEAGPAVRGAFLEVTIAPPAPRRKPKGKAKSTTPGLRATLTDAAGKAKETVLIALGGPGLKTLAQEIAPKGDGPWKKIAIDGEFEVKVPGVYQLDVLATGNLRLEVDGQRALEREKSSTRAVGYGLVNLEAGWHALKIEFAPEGAPDLTVLLSGAQVGAPLTGASLRH